MIEDIGTPDRGWGWLNIAVLLTQPYRSRLTLPQKIGLLRCCRIMPAGNADGWRIQVDKTGVVCGDFEPAIDQALDLLEGKPQLFPPMEAL